MPRRSRGRRGRNRPRRSEIMFPIHGVFSAGAGQINITADKLFAEVLSGQRHIRPKRVTIAICLRSETALVPTESVSINLYSPLGQSVARFGPFLLDSRARTWSFKWPFVVPGDYLQSPSTAKVFSIYDYGDDSKAGMVVSAKVWAEVSAPSVPQKTEGKIPISVRYAVPSAGHEGPSRSTSDRRCSI